MRKGFEGARFLLDTTVPWLAPSQKEHTCPSRRVSWSHWAFGDDARSPAGGSPSHSEGSLLPEHRLRWHSSFGSPGGEPSM